MFTAKLILENGGEKKEYEIPPNEEIFIGRELIGINDKSISRKQIAIKFEEKGGVITAVKQGSRDSFVYFAENEKIKTEMKRGEKVEVHDGDSIQLSDSTPKFLVQIKRKKLQQQSLDNFVTKRKREETTDDYNDNSFTTSTNTTTINNTTHFQSQKYQKQNHSQNSSPFKKTNNSNNSNKNNNTNKSGEKEREICPFGIKCYRTNPHHFLEFSHPGHPNDLPPPSPPSTTPHSLKDIQEKNSSPNKRVKTSNNNNTNNNTNNSSTKNRSNNYDNDNNENITNLEQIINLVPENDKLDFSLLSSSYDSSINTNKNNNNSNNTTSINKSYNNSIGNSSLLVKGRKKSEDLIMDEDEFEDSFSLINNSNTLLKSESNPSSNKNSNTLKHEKGEKGKERGEKTLVFCSLSTSAFMYKIEEASKVLTKAVSLFLEEHKDPFLKLILVDFQESETLQAHRQTWLQQNNKDPRFEIKVADVTHLFSTFGIKAKFLANSCNNLLSPKGSGINKALHEAIPCLAEETKKLYTPPAKVGNVYPVSLPPFSKYRNIEGVEYIIHVYSPNMNPQRPDCLFGDYETGNPLLLSSYLNLFRCFANLAKLQSTKPIPSTFLSNNNSNNNRNSNNSNNNSNNNSSNNSNNNNNNFNKEKRITLSPPKFPKFLLSKQNNNPPSSEGNKSKDSTPSITPNLSPNNSNPSSPDKKSNKSFSPNKSPSKKETTNKKGKSGNNYTGNWKEALFRIIENPSNNELTIFYDEELVLIKDKYPKAKHHFLILPRKKMPDFSFLTKQEIPLLLKMNKMAIQKALELKITNPLIGFHALPSLSQVHLHLLSNDLDSPCLTNKKHFNSFTTEFFVKVDFFVDLLKKTGKISFERSYFEELLKSDLKCHHCGVPCKNIPVLKEHISLCKNSNKKQKEFIL